MRYDDTYAIRVVLASIIFFIFSFLGAIPFYIFIVYLLLLFLSVLAVYYGPKYEKSIHISIGEYLTSLLVLALFFYATFIPVITYIRYTEYSIYENLAYIYSASILETSLYTILPLNLLEPLMRRHPYLIPIIAPLSAISIIPLHIQAWGGLYNAVLAWLGYTGLNIGYTISEIYLNIPAEGTACDLHFIHNILMLTILQQI